MRALTGGLGALRRVVRPDPRRHPPGPGPLPPCPPGWRTGPPDFVGVGSKKAGTSWWHSLITEHPGVHRRIAAVPGLDPPRIKEVHFFQQWWASGDGEAAAEYHRYFPRPEGLLVGEWTPRYMVDFWTPAQLRAAAPEARVLVMVRDPVERYASGVRHYLARHGGVVDHPRVLVDEVEHGRYAAGLARVARHFPPDQVLVLQYERCVQQPEVELARTYGFLGLADTEFRPEAVTRPVNASRGAAFAVDQGIRRELVAEYEDDVRRLAARWPIDLGLWKNFAHLVS